MSRCVYASTTLLPRPKKSRQIAPKRSGVSRVINLALNIDASQLPDKDAQREACVYCHRVQVRHQLGRPLADRRIA
jgi:hypothetical protein